MQITENTKVEGQITTTAVDHRKDPPHVKLWNKSVEFLLDRGVISRQRARDAYWIWSDSIVKQQHNTVVFAGIEKMFQRLADDTNDNVRITDAALGSGSSVSPGTGDTTLDSEDYRNSVASASAQDNEMFVDAFYTQSETSGTFTEFGYFIDGDGSSAGSGTMWNHVTIDVTKDNSTSLFIDGKFTLTNS